jgi:hypothetical protein
VSSPLFEVKTRACDQVLHGSRHEYLASPGKRGDARSNMDGDALHITAGHFDLAGVQSATDLNFERADGLDNRASAANGARRTVERGQKSVSKRFDLAAAVPSEFSPHARMMSTEQIAPASIAHLLGERCRANDVREQNCRKDSMALSDGHRAGEKLLYAITDLFMQKKEMILSGQLDQSRARGCSVQ